MIMNVVKNIKVIHPKHILLVKVGAFYHAYGRDAYILSYLFGYKLITVDNDVPSCGFGVQTLNKVIANLEKEKINYLAVDRRNNYEVDLIMDFSKKNNYDTVYPKARRYVNFKRRIDEINRFLVENV